MPSAQTNAIEHGRNIGELFTQHSKRFKKPLTESKHYRCRRMVHRKALEEIIEAVELAKKKHGLADSAIIDVLETMKRNWFKHGNFRGKV